MLARHTSRFGALLSQGCALLGRNVVQKRGFAANEVAQPVLSPTNLRNLSVIAHVDHGKTTLVDKLLQQCGENVGSERVMDSMDIEKERGVTIRSKVTAVNWKGVRLNIVDTPGHADFGGEVERVLSMVDGVLLLVDATEGPMTQTKFVLTKALERGLRPIVVINKVDRDSSRVAEVEDEIFELFVLLNATEEQLDFPFMYSSGRQGWCVADRSDNKDLGMGPLLDTIISHIPAPAADTSLDFKMSVSMISHDKYLGRLVQGRIASGVAKLGDSIHALRMKPDGQSEIIETGRIIKIMVQQGTSQMDVATACAGDIVQISGLEKATVADTVAVPSVTEAIFCKPVDPPTVSMFFGANDSPFQGKEGNKLTSQMIVDRLKKEIQNNVSISLRETGSETIEVMGRGEMQLGVLIETMRREGFEMSISPPKVVLKQEGGKTYEPLEEVFVEVDDNHTGGVIDTLTRRGGEMLEMKPAGGGRTRMQFLVTSRGLVGYKAQFRMDTHGSGIIYSSFSKYVQHKGVFDRPRKGVLVSSAQGPTTAYALNSLEARGVLFVGPRTETYVGMIIGEYTRDADLEVNPTKAKQLTNMRAAGADEGIFLTPPRIFSLEEAICYVLDDELIEVTPKSIRMRKAILDPSQRKVVNRGR